MDPSLSTPPPPVAVRCQSSVCPKSTQEVNGPLDLSAWPARAGLGAMRLRNFKSPLNEDASWAMGTGSQRPPGGGGYARRGKWADAAKRRQWGRRAAHVPIRHDRDLRGGGGGGKGNGVWAFPGGVGNPRRGFPSPHPAALVVVDRRAPPAEATE